MKNMVYIERSFLGIFIALLMNLDLLLGSVNENLMAKDIFIRCIFDESTIFKEKSLVLTFLYIAIIVFFVLLYGNYFRDHFSNTGVYFFLRHKRRISWYKKYTVELLFYSIIYTFTYTFSVLIMSLYHTKEEIDISLLNISLIIWFALVIIVYIITLIENIISIRYGSIIGELIAIFILILLIQLCLHQESYALFQKYEISRYINPLSGMKLSTLVTIKEKLRIIVIYLLEIGIVWGIGYLLLKVTDILDKK